MPHILAYCYLGLATISGLIISVCAIFVTRALCRFLNRPINIITHNDAPFTRQQPWPSISQTPNQQ